MTKVKFPSRSTHVNVYQTPMRPRRPLRVPNAPRAVRYPIRTLSFDEEEKEDDDRISSRIQTFTPYIVSLEPHTPSREDDSPLLLPSISEYLEELRLE